MYDDLVKRLRNCTSDTVEDCTGCPYQGGYKGTYCMNGLITEAADAIEEIATNYDAATNIMKHQTEYIEELSKPRWTPVTERLPEQGKRYLVIRFDEVTKTQFIDILWHDAHDLWWNRLYKGHYNVTHWMPLPEPPKEE